MTRIALAAIVVCLLSFAATAQAQDQTQVGQKVYTSQKCSVCHSIGGTGNKKGPLDGIGAKLSADQIRQWIVNAPEMTAKAGSTRKPAMKAYMLAKEDLDGLVAYLASLKK